MREKILNRKWKIADINFVTEIWDQLNHVRMSMCELIIHESSPSVFFGKRQWREFGKQEDR